MKHIDTEKLQKELSKLSDEKLAKFMMLLPICPNSNNMNWNFGLWTKGIESGIFVTKKEWKKYCKEKNITTIVQWDEHCDSGKRQSNIPSEPARYYARTETWLGWPKELRNEKNPLEKRNVSDKDILNYINGQVSSYELAEKYNCSYGTICNHAKYYKKEHNIK